MIVNRSTYVHLPTSSRLASESLACPYCNELLLSIVSLNRKSCRMNVYAVEYVHKILFEPLEISHCRLIWTRNSSLSCLRAQQDFKCHRWNFQLENSNFDEVCICIRGYTSSRLGMSACVCSTVEHDASYQELTPPQLQFVGIEDRDTNVWENASRNVHYSSHLVPTSNQTCMHAMPCILRRPLVGRTSFEVSTLGTG